MLRFKTSAAAAALNHQTLRVMLESDSLVQVVADNFDETYTCPCSFNDSHHNQTLKAEVTPNSGPNVPENQTKMSVQFLKLYG